MYVMNQPIDTTPKPNTSRLKCIVPTRALVHGAAPVRLAWVGRHAGCREECGAMTRDLRPA
jgi:hypothetical protein